MVRPIPHQIWLNKCVDFGVPEPLQNAIFVFLSTYMVTQSGEAVIFRFVILTLPARCFRKKAEIQIAPA